MSQFIVSVVAATGVMCVAGASWAQSASSTDTGRVLDSVQPRLPSGRLQSAPEVQVKPGGTASSSLPNVGQQIEVKEFRIEGATMLSLPRLEKVLEPYTNRSLTLSQMQEAADAVTQTYREAGYVLAQALVLPQAINNGVVVITVREGQIEKVDVKSAAQGPVPGVVQNGLAQAMPLNKPLSTRDLEDVLLLVNDLPARGRASAEIAPNAQGDAAVVSVTYTPPPRLQGSVTADSHGNRYTGSNRVIGQLVINEPLGAGDQFSLTGLSTGSLLSYAQMAYRFPVTPRLSLGASASWLDYKLCCQNPGVRVEGGATSWGLDAAYHLSLRRGENSTLYANLDSRRLDSERNGIEQTDRQVDALSLGLRGYTTVGTVRSWNAALRVGRVDLGGNAIDLNQNVTTGIEGRFSKLTGSFYQNQVISGAWSWIFQARGQYNFGRNLESSERIALGGADGVRGYPSGEGVGDHGWLASAELRYAFAAAPGLSAAVFADGGGIKRYSKNRAAVLSMMGQTDNSYSLAGAGIGIRYETQKISLLLQVARPIGSNKGADTAGNNNEGRRDGQTQAWLSASLRF
jgi:hemolysin activation/secretion protein